LDDDISLTPLVCEGCSGTVYTDKGGVFQLKIKASHSSLHNTRDFPVQIFYSKTSPGSPPISHEFLCESGATPCDTEKGDLHYLRHLLFDKEVVIWDDTSIPFSGKVTIADTEGCVLPRVNVCAMHNDTSGVFVPIVCVESGVNGIYELPIVEGAMVHDIELDYHEHDFDNLSDIDYSVGYQILAENAPYFDNDFEDVSKAEVRVEVVGGKCNKFLGKSSVLIKVANCVWEPEPFVQSDNIIDFTNIPAHIMNIEVVDIVDSDESTIFPIWQVFQGTNPIVRSIDLRDVGAELENEQTAVESSSSRTDTGKENTAAEDRQDEELSAIEEKEDESLDTVRFQYDGVLKMEVVIDRSEDKYPNSCEKEEEDQPNPADFNGADSLHVMEYMKTFTVDVYFQYQILEGVTCDIVDDDLRLQVVNNVGFDTIAGSQQFEDSITDTLTKLALAYCNPQAVQYCSAKDLFLKYDPCVCPEEEDVAEECTEDCASCLGECDIANCGTAVSQDEWETCLNGSGLITEGTTCNAACSELCETSGCAFQVEHDTNDDNENTGGARVAGLIFATGRPNIVAPYTKSIIFRAIGADVVHKAAIFIEGLYSKGPGNSFALPTHEPIMILRDPPGKRLFINFSNVSLFHVPNLNCTRFKNVILGGLSYAKYENVVTTMKIKSSADETSIRGQLKVGASVTTKSSTELCIGGGGGLLGPLFATCNNLVSSELGVGM